MAKLLHISASPRGTRSHSLAVAEAFLKAYCAAHPGHEPWTCGRRTCHAKLIIFQDAGHGFLFQRAERCARDVNEFFAERRPRSRGGCPLAAVPFV